MRKALGLKAGAKVRFTRHGRKVILEAVVEPPVDSLFGTFKALKGRGIRDIDAALEELRQQRAATPRRRGRHG
jgi:bifunctional DNA-binding transcriptional regulator/antitoxin component of YhaV-PrlF toxin-antitoxin module